MLSIQLLFAVLTFVPCVKPRGARINIYEQQARFSRGSGDIANLWGSLSTNTHIDKMRNALKPTSPNRWTRYINAREQYVIPYIIGGSFDDSELSTISKAMMAIAQNTCIKFQKRGGEADFVEIKNERGEGCYTTVGRTPGKNVVMLETNSISTCLEFDIVIHELMHTIGLWHEQMRYDRDDYIRIHYENIAPSYYTQFEKIRETDSTTYGVKYDYESVMHYAKDAFASTPGKLTMETVDKRYQDIIGKVKDASPSDYVKICSIYGCKRCMGKAFPISPEPIAVEKTADEQGETFNINSIFAPDNNNISVDPLAYAIRKSNDSLKVDILANANANPIGFKKDNGMLIGHTSTERFPVSTPIHDDGECHEKRACRLLVRDGQQCSIPSVRRVCCETCFRQKFISLPTRSV